MSSDAAITDDALEEEEGDLGDAAAATEGARARPAPE